MKPPVMQLLPHARPVSAAAPLAQHRERSVTVCCDDLPAGRCWSQQLSAEGLQVQAQALDDQAPWPSDAWVLHICGRLPDHLGRLRSLRARSPHTPVLLALRNLRDLDQVLGLEMGADDVIDGQTASSVVAARLRALWRRGLPAHHAQPAHELRFGGLELQLMQRQAHRDGQPVPLSEGEFEVLWLLASHAGRALSRRELLQAVRGLDDHPLDRSIDNRVYRIRAKLADPPGARQRIRTVRNHGYVFCPQGW